MLNRAVLAFAVGASLLSATLNRPAFADPPLLRMTPAKDFYVAGDSVRILLFNESDLTLVLPESPRCKVYRSSNGIPFGLVYPSYQVFDPLELLPGESVEFIWDQTDLEGEQVEPREYVAETLCRIGEGGPWEYFTCVFEIRAGTPVQPMTWGAIKALFR
jgi:hypothetical protein